MFSLGTGFTTEYSVIVKYPGQIMEKYIEYCMPSNNSRAPSKFESFAHHLMKFYSDSRAY